MKKIVIAAVIICMGLAAQAQIATFLAPGKSGLGIQVLAEQGRYFKGFGASIGGTYKGIIDVSVMGTNDIYDKSSNELLTDKAIGNYLEGKVTCWLFRNQITEGLDAHFGVLAGFESGFYKDYVYLNTSTGNNAEYTKYLGGMAGLKAAFGFNLKGNWYLHPSIEVYYDFGKDYETELGTGTETWYTGVMSNICVSLVRRMENGNAFVISANYFDQTYDSSVFYNLTAGYIFSF
ncbi:MAG: hypothetical protein V2A67_05570 [Bacteroidota bacterium]